MLKIPTKEEYYAAYEKLTPVLKDAFESPDIAETIESACQQNHLDYNRTNAVLSLFGNMLLGFTHPEDLAKCISELTKIDIRISEAIAKDIRAKILPALANDLVKLYGYHINGISKDIFTAAMPHPTQDEKASTFPVLITKIVETPIRVANNNIKATVESPFILHANPQPEGGIMTAEDNYSGLVRPTFYAPPSGDISENETPRARLEIGTPNIQEEPQTARIGKESARVV